LQNKLVELSIHNEQNGNRHVIRAAGSATNAVAAQVAGSV
jgi:hypothetical protein